MTDKMFELKTLLKEKTIEIRETRSKFKESQREGKYVMACALLTTLEKLRPWYRHHHIAYSLLRGTPYELIEKPAEENLPDMALVERIKHEYTDVLSDVCLDKA